MGAVNHLSVNTHDVSVTALRTRDRLLEPGEELPLGTHIFTPRRGYTHHGIYVGHGKVIQYAGLAAGLHRGPVEEVALAQFARGRPIGVRFEESCLFDGPEIARRARSRLGENRYSLLTNNCEHFCEWCVRDQHHSHQVAAWRWRPNRPTLFSMVFGVSAVIAAIIMVAVISTVIAVPIALVVPVAT